MFSQKMQDAINKQINEELYSAYLYLAMSAHSMNVSLTGFANWLRVQAMEEMTHAMKFYDYINDRGGKVVLNKVEQPTLEWESPKAIFEDVLKHEMHITQCINNLVNLAYEEKDHASQIMLQWFVNEQIEEEASASEILHKLKLTAGEGSGLFMIDRELATRVFVPPAPTNQK